MVAWAVSYTHLDVYKRQFEKGDKGYPMIKEAARRYALENDLNLDLEQAEIVREEKGKPYFADLPQMCIRDSPYCDCRSGHRYFDRDCYRDGKGAAEI